MSRPKLLPQFLIAAALLLSGCESVRSWVPPLLQPYRPDVQQGNVVTKEMVDQLATGMTREQVRFMLGTPALVSVFHVNRWDYVYLLKRGKGSEVQSRRLTVYFKDNRVERFDADAMPPEALADNLILGRDPKDLPTPPPKATEPIFSRDVNPKDEVDIDPVAIPPVGF
jgi:outer membrane protein assembly factor BamE